MREAYMVIPVDYAPADYYRTPNRQTIAIKSGAGCILCGQPVCVYHGIDDAASAPGGIPHAGKMVMLCLQHQRQLHTGAITLQQLAAAQEKPFNLQKVNPVVKPLQCSGDKLQVVLGHITLYSNYALSSVTGESVTITNNRTSRYFEGNSIAPLIVDNDKLLEITVLKQQLTFSLLLFDEWNRLLLRVNKNLVSYSADEVDCRIQNGSLSVTQNNQPLLQLQYDAPAGSINVTYARFQLNGVQCVVENGSLHINGERVTVTETELSKPSPFGILIGARPSYTTCIKHLEKVRRVSS